MTRVRGCKKFTNDYILAAIEECKSGLSIKNSILSFFYKTISGMSLLQASKKYRVPSRILLDKLQQKYNEDEILAAIEEIKSGMSLNKAPLVSWL